MTPRKYENFLKIREKMSYHAAVTPPVSVVFYCFLPLYLELKKQPQFNKVSFFSLFYFNYATSFSIGVLFILPLLFGFVNSTVYKASIFYSETGGGAVCNVS